MSHGPESHETHHEQSEPERVPIQNPGEDYMVVDPVTFTTTHKGPNGDFYTIENKNIAQASNRLHDEKKRNARLQDAVANGLYRLNAQETAFRPAPSDKELPFIAATDLGQHEYGVSDKFKNKNLMDSDTLNKIGSNIFISTGHGPKLIDTDGNSHDPNNEKGEIDKRSASIVLSYEARDKAMADGKTPEEAQEIGSQEYRRQEDFRALKEQEHNEHHPEGLHTDEPAEGELTDKENSNEDEEIVVENDTEQNEKNEQRTEAVKKFFRKIGVNALSGAKIVRKAGAPLLAHAGHHKAIDTVDGAFEKFEDASEAAGDKARETIENLPFIASLAVEKASQELLMSIDLTLDKMTQLAENAIDKTQETAVELAKRLAEQFKKAIEMLGEKRDQLIKYWQERYERVINKLRAYIAKRQEQWNAFNSEADTKSTDFVHSILTYMLTKHRNDLRYYNKTQA